MDGWMVVVVEEMCGGRGVVGGRRTVPPSERVDASPESFNSYHKRDRVNESQREPGDQRWGWEGVCVCVCVYLL